MRSTHSTPQLPFTRSYTVIPERLLAGFYPGDRDRAVARTKLNGLLNWGVTHIVNLMQTHERDHAGRSFHPYEAEFLRLAEARALPARCARHSIPDLAVPSVAHMQTTLDLIDGALANGGCLYVHCWGGRGRTGTVIGCWLARHGAIDPLRQLQQLTAHAHDQFGTVPETAQQQAFVRQWRAGQ